MLQAIKHQRNQMGLTQRQVGEQMGISRSHYSDIENGRKKIDLPKARLLVEILKLDPLIFFEDVVA
jgi:transcriptional regulator with XRE-family HTH domain